MSVWEFLRKRSLWAQASCPLWSGPRSRLHAGLAARRCRTAGPGKDAPGSWQLLQDQPQSCPLTSPPCMGFSCSTDLCSVCKDRRQRVQEQEGGTSGMEEQGLRPFPAGAATAARNPPSGSVSLPGFRQTPVWPPISCVALGMWPEGCVTMK